MIPLEFWYFEGVGISIEFSPGENAARHINNKRRDSSFIDCYCACRPRAIYSERRPLWHTKKLLTRLGRWKKSNLSQWFFVACYSPVMGSGAYQKIPFFFVVVAFFVVRSRFDAVQVLSREIKVWEKKKIPLREMLTFGQIPLYYYLRTRGLRVSWLASFFRPRYPCQGNLEGTRDTRLDSSRVRDILA